MRFQGDQTIKAPRERVWEFLIDPQLATKCAPGLERLDVLDDRRFRAVGKVPVGPIKGAFIVEGIWLEREAPERARVRARGKVPGHTVEVEVRLTLSAPKLTTTAVHWEADVKLKGLLALTGGRGLQRAADAASNALFSCVKANLKAADRAESSAPD
jgi:carbon monoxide dehydrogenase subunit G